MGNQSTYEIVSVVSEYTAAAELQAPEQAVLKLLAAELRDMRMLDIGIGGGRTTVHFAPLVKEYAGIDYSGRMIDACRGRFPSLANRNALSVADARALTAFPDDRFDFVLFSFNGIDYVSPEDRLLVLREIARVARAGARFLFSTHNLNSDIESTFVRSGGDGLREFLTKPLNRMRFRLLNWGWRRHRASADYMVLNDGAHGFRLNTCYIGAAAQLRQLRSAGFSDTVVFARDGGRLAIDEAERSTDAWLHYLSTVVKGPGPGAPANAGSRPPSNSIQIGSPAGDVGRYCFRGDRGL